MTTAWAGPFVGNVLGALGMDVLKFEGLPPFDGYRVLRLHSDSDPSAWAELKGDNRWFESSGLHNAVNRNKRDVVVDLRASEGREVFLDLARHADAVLCNFTAKVLPGLGLDFDALAAVNPGIVVVRMPAFGTIGPYSAKAGYGPVIEGMGGFGARFGYADEGARISDLYWPDPVAGTHAALRCWQASSAATAPASAARSISPTWRSCGTRSAKGSSSPTSAAPTSAGWATANPASRRRGSCRPPMDAGWRTSGRPCSPN